MGRSSQLSPHSRTLPASSWRHDRPEISMRGRMMQTPLLISSLIEHAGRVYGNQ